MSVIVIITECLIIQQLLKQHDTEIKELEQRLDNERSRQLAALREKLSSRKDRRLKEQKQQHELEVQKEMLEQKSEVERMRTNKVSSSRDSVQFGTCLFFDTARSCIITCAFPSKQ